MYNATDGTIKTTAGAGGTAKLGDGGPAVNANVGKPHGVAVDSVGNIYFAASLYNRIRMVNVTTNVITTVSGSGELGGGRDEILAVATQHNFPMGIAIDAFDNLFVADTWNHRVR